MEESKTKTLGSRILTIIITAVATIIILIIILASWLLIKNPLNVRGILLYKLGWVNEPVMLIPADEGGTEAEDPGATPESDTAPLPLTPQQRQAVEDFGINPDSVIITPAMENCFVEKLGQERVDEIKAGAAPGALDMLKARSCL